MERGERPVHDAMGPVARAIEALSIALALGLLASHVARVASDPLAWLSLPVLAALAIGAVLADFGSGLVHWFADTWGRESMPLLGRRFLRPFRVHHQNPDDLLERDFVDCNGDVAMLTVPFFAAAWLVPDGGELGRAASALLVGFAAVSLPTNQVHQWAHDPAPPRPVGWLQRARLILPRAEHQRHHQPPHLSHYCIATGWCNGPLGRAGFFPALERAITRVTGVEPRTDTRAAADTNPG
jgi:ubiquitin-conjugating enzyme E2 variant